MIMKLLKIRAAGVVLLLTALSSATNSAQQSALMSHDPLDPIAPTRQEECTALTKEWDQRIEVLQRESGACVAQVGERCWQLQLKNSQAGQACWQSERNPAFARQDVSPYFSCESAHRAFLAAVDNRSVSANRCRDKVNAASKTIPVTPPSTSSGGNTVYRPAPPASLGVPNSTPPPARPVVLPPSALTPGRNAAAGVPDDVDAAIAKACAVTASPASCISTARSLANLGNAPSRPAGRGQPVDRPSTATPQTPQDLQAAIRTQCGTPNPQAGFEAYTACLTRVAQQLMNDDGPGTTNQPTAPIPFVPPTFGAGVGGRSAPRPGDVSNDSDLARAAAEIAGLVESVVAGVPGGGSALRRKEAELDEIFRESSRGEARIPDSQEQPEATLPLSEVAEAVRRGAPTRPYDGVLRQEHDRPATIPDAAEQPERTMKFGTESARPSAMWQQVLTSRTWSDDLEKDSAFIAYLRDNGIEIITRGGKKLVGLSTPKTTYQVTGNRLLLREALQGSAAPGNLR
jgi:hypothetical protein